MSRRRTREKPSRFWRAVPNWVALLTVISLALPILGGVIAGGRAIYSAVWGRPDYDVKVETIGVTESVAEGLVIFNLKVSNTGKKIAALNEVRINVLQVEPLYLLGYSLSTLPPPPDFHVGLADDVPVPYVRSYPIALVLEARDYADLTIKVAVTEPRYDASVFVLTPLIAYDGARVATSEMHVTGFNIHDPQVFRVASETLITAEAPSLRNIDRARWNKSVVDRVSKAKGHRSSNVKNLIDRFNIALESTPSSTR